MADVSKFISHPLVNSRTKLFGFLRKYGIIVDKLPAPEFVASLYFTVEFRHIVNGSYRSTYPMILVSDKGVKFINKLVELIYNGK